jgi:integrase
MPVQTFDPQAPISGHVKLYEGKRRKTWVAKWRDQHGQHEKVLGPAWTGKGKPPEGFHNERTAGEKLDEILVDARRGVLRQQRTGLIFRDVAEEWFEWGCAERDWSASTRKDYRSILDAHLLPEFGDERIEQTNNAKRIERWRKRLLTEELSADGPRSARTINKVLTILHGILKYAVKRHGLLTNEAAEVDRLRESNDPDRFDFYTPEEIDLLVATAAAGEHRDPKRPAVSETERVLRQEEDEQDAAIYLTAAHEGMRRSELLALLWEDIDFEQKSIRVWEGYAAKTKGKTKSRKSRTVPMVDKVEARLEKLKRRGHHTDRNDHVFVNRDGTPLDGSALRRRYIRTLTAAKLRRLRFHDLRHTFGSLAINVASIVQVQHWMGHKDIKTTMRYLHHKSRADDARLLSTAFQSKKPARTRGKREASSETEHAPELVPG